jgi:hypothetical protein
VRHRLPGAIYIKSGTLTLKLIPQIWCTIQAMVDASPNPETVPSQRRANNPRSANGQFVSRYAERRGQAIALRLPLSLDHQLRATAGWRSKADNKQLTAWIEAAILEKLQRQGPVLGRSLSTDSLSLLEGAEPPES